MSLVIVCPGCERTLRVPEHAGGKTIQCPRCGKQLKVPTATSADAVTTTPPETAPARRRKPAQADAVTTVTPADEGPAAPRRRPRVKPFPLRIKIKDPDRELSGMFAAEVQRDGIELKIKKKTVLLEIGSSAHYLKANQLEVEYEDRSLTLSILKPFHYMNRLSEDLADFLQGELDTLDIADYRVPWYLYLPALLPLGIPILTQGGGLWCGLAGGFVGGAVGIAQKEDWPAPTRLVAATALGLAGYGIVVLILYLWLGALPW